MSAGNVVTDLRTTVSTSCGSGKIGSYYSKNWSGADGERSHEHAYSMVCIRQYDSLVSWKFTWLPGSVFTGTAGSCGFGPVFNSWPVIDPNDEIKAVNRLVSKVRGHDFNAAVNIGEAKESIRMIGDTARALASSVLKLKRGDVTGSLRSLGLKPKTAVVRDVQGRLRNGLSSAWLGMTYGWLPLLGAVEDACEALANGYYRRRKIVFKASVKGQGGSIASNTVGVLEHGKRFKWIVDEKQFSTLEEFGFVSPELVAWELLPFSFVGDWFIPVGSWLEARAALPLLKGTNVTSTLKRFNIEMAGGTTVPGHIILSGRSTYQRTELTRTVGAISDLVLPKPTWKNPLSVNHAISGIALLQQVFLRDRR